MKEVSVLVGAGSIGQAIIRRVSAGKHVVLADYSEENANRAAKTLENAGFECSTIRCDLGNKEDILALVAFATSKGEVKYLVNAAGVSPSQAPVEEILRVDLYGTSVLMEEFGKVMADGGSGIIISSQSGHRLPARRAGTPDEVGDLAEFLMSSRGRFISGADFLIDGGCTASYWYGDLQYLKATH